MKNNNLFNIIPVIIFGLSLISCDPNDIVKRRQGEWVKDTLKDFYETYQINLKKGFVDAGTLPAWDDHGAKERANNIVGTTWVLTKMVSGFASTKPNDTIVFLNRDQYTSTTHTGGLKGYPCGYTLTTTPGGTSTKTLTFYTFTSFGGATYSGQVGQNFVQDRTMDNIEFHNIEIKTSKIRAWFKRIK